MRYVGLITDWNDEKGFGFITPEGSGIRTFVHMTAFRRGSPRPVIGTVISYEVVIDNQGRFNATRAQFVTPIVRTNRPTRRGLPRKGIAALFLIAITAGCMTSQFPASLALVYAIMSAIAFRMYGQDKAAADNDRWRIPESKLQFVGLFGGWPGALFAQEAFRHKVSKSEFQILFWFAVTLNCAGLAWLLTSGYMEIFDRAMVEVVTADYSHPPQKIDVQINPLPL